MKATKAEQKRFNKMIQDVEDKAFKSGLRAAVDFVVNDEFDIKDLLGYYGIHDEQAKNSVTTGNSVIKQSNSQI